MKSTPSREDSNGKQIPPDLVIPGPNKLPRGIIPSSWPKPWDEQSDRVRTFPYHGWDGRVATWKVRRSSVPKEQRYRPNKSGPFAYKPEHAFLPYGLPKLRRAMYEGVDTIFWTSGPTDTEPFWLADHVATSFFSSETRIKPEHVEVLRKLKEDTGWDNQMVLVVDDDDTGYRMLPAWLEAFDSVFSNVVPVIPLIGKDARDHFANDYGPGEFVPLGPDGWNQRAFTVLADDERTRKEINGGYRIQCFVDSHDDNNPSVEITRGEKSTLIRDRAWMDDPDEHDKHIAEGLKAHGLTWAMLKYRNRDGSLVGAEGEKTKTKGFRRYCPDPGDPREVARHIEDEFQEDGCSTILARGTSQFHFNGRHWEDVERRAIESLLWNRMDSEEMLKVINEKEKVVRWAPTPSKIGALYDAVMSMHYKRDDEIQPGEWWSGQYDSQAIYIPMANGILQVKGEERKLLPSTPRYFSLDARPYAYDPEAKCPAWLAFLDSVFGDDHESIDLIQMWFGYVASGRTDLEKAIALIGPTRAGKGVVCDACEALVGEPATASLRLSDLPKDFGLEKLIGKPLTIIPDNKGGALRADKMQSAVENLLSLIANDKMPINQKNKKERSIRLATRVMMASNEIHQFMDASKAIDERLIIVKFKKSFAGKEDSTLKRRIAQEAAGIFNWSLDGLDRLDVSKKLMQPKSAAGYRDMAQAETPHEMFVQQILEIGSEFTTTLDELGLYWKPFAEALGMKSAGLINHLPSKLMPIIERFGGELVREREETVNTNGKRGYYYKGARIRPQESGPKTKSMNGVQL